MAKKVIKKSPGEWHQLLMDCDNRPENTTIKDWCERKGISTNSYDYWRRKLRGLKRDSITEDAVTFAPLPMELFQSCDEQNHSTITIRFQDFEILVNEQSPLVLLTNLLATLRSIC